MTDRIKVGSDGRYPIRAGQQRGLVGAGPDMMLFPKRAVVLGQGFQTRNRPRSNVPAANTNEQVRKTTIRIRVYQQYHQVQSSAVAGSVGQA
jgi:hypothetical protein